MRFYGSLTGLSRVFLVALVVTLLGGRSAHAGIVVWLHEEMPDDKATAKADNKTGGTEHLSYFELAHPPMPASSNDEAEYDALRGSVSDGQKRWHDFEVEFGIATNIAEKIGAIDVIRSDRDLDELVAALLFQGAAIDVAFEPDTFRDEDRAAPFRFERTGGAGNLPWSNAYALDPERKVLPSDVADGATFPSLQADQEFIRGRAVGTLNVGPPQEGVQLVVDGVVQEDPLASLELPPGMHWVHLVKAGMIFGRRVVMVDSGRESTFEPYVSTTDLEAARARVDGGSTTQLPEAVRQSLEVLAVHYPGQVFVGSDIEGKTVVLPYAAGASLLKQRPVTVVGTGEVGGGIATSAVFDGSDGNRTLAPMGMGHLGLELGIYNFAVVAGTDMMVTPGHTVTHGNGDETANVDTSVFLQPYGGLGVYLLRPTGRTTTALISAYYQFLHPAHHGVGGNVSLGLPFEPDGGTWIKLSIGGTGAPSSIWDEGTDSTPLVLLYVRTGLSARF